MPKISKEEKTPIVKILLKIIEQLKEIIEYKSEQSQQMKDEIAILRGQKPRPNFKPSKMDEKTGKAATENEAKKGKRPGSEKRKKTKELKIHEEQLVAAKNVPKGSRFKGYNYYTVQGLRIEVHNIRYKMENWVSPSGEYISATLPEEVKGKHFDQKLEQYVLHQAYQCDVTQPLLLEQLREFGIDISSGQINQILTVDKESYHDEKAEILKAGLQVSTYVSVDDTGSRNNGKNGYCTQIGNELFAWFKSTDTKSRVNFLELLQAGELDYKINQEAIDYVTNQRLKKDCIEALQKSDSKQFGTDKVWKTHLELLGIQAKRHIRIATEGALIGSLLENDFMKTIVILSDDAGQFNVLLHALCWIHAERTIHKLIPATDEQREIKEKARDKIWGLYADLKAYKDCPCIGKKKQLILQFETIFTSKTGYHTLDKAMLRLYKNKTELLLVLDRPEIPLHTNGSENDIRGCVKTRKVKGGTRSDIGRKCRDTYMTLKKTCRRHGISFWAFLGDRISGERTIPFLPNLILQKAASP